ncbi:MAG: flagellar motor switch protein FliN/FliY [Zhongshania sp.]|jgi:flagellar motor switch protein FliN/FliY
MTDQTIDEQVNDSATTKPNTKAAGAESKTLNDNNAAQTTSPKQGAGRVTKDMSLDMIMDVNVSVAVEVGRTKMSIRELRDLNQGAIIELDRAAGTPLDVLVNGTLVARGEIVVVKEKYGIMLTEVVGQEERERH